MDTNKNDAQISVVNEEQMQKEFDYMMAQRMLKDMLEKDLISLAEFNKISALNLVKFWECKIVCVKRNCTNLLYAPYWGNQS